MEIFLKDIKEIALKNIPLRQRGILITILLLKDSSKNVTYTKFKESVKIDDFVKCDLIDLQERGYINWSGYKSAVKTFWKMSHNKDVLDVISFMNNLYNRRFDHTKDGTVKDLRNRLNEYTVEEIKKVISNRYIVWKDDSYMQKFLEPTTIFRKSKFPKYLEEAERTGEGLGIVEVEKINMSDGDEIRLKDSISFIDKDTYNVEVFSTDSSGSAMGNGIPKTVYGRDLKMLIKVQNNIKKRSGKVDYIYKFKNK